MDEHEAVDTVLSEISDFVKHDIGDNVASLEQKGSDEMQIILSLPSLPFRFRLDRASPQLCWRVISDLLLRPLLDVTNAVLGSASIDLGEYTDVGRGIIA